MTTIVLSPREQQVGALLASGYTDKQIAAALAIEYHTVRTYVVAIAFKLRIPGGHNTRVLITRWWLAHQPPTDTSFDAAG